LKEVDVGERNLKKALMFKASHNCTAEKFLA
jgi:hypothetical protein